MMSAETTVPDPEEKGVKVAPHEMLDLCFETKLSDPSAERARRVYLTLADLGDSWDESLDLRETHSDPGDNRSRNAESGWRSKLDKPLEAGTSRDSRTGDARRKRSDKGFKGRSRTLAAKLVSRPESIAGFLESGKGSRSWVVSVCRQMLRQLSCQTERKKHIPRDILQLVEDTACQSVHWEETAELLRDSDPLSSGRLAPVEVEVRALARIVKGFVPALRHELNSGGGRRDQSQRICGCCLVWAMGVQYASKHIRRFLEDHDFWDKTKVLAAEARVHNKEMHASNGNTSVLKIPTAREVFLAAGKGAWELDPTIVPDGSTVGAQLAATDSRVAVVHREVGGEQTISYASCSGTLHEHIPRVREWARAAGSSREDARVDLPRREHIYEALPKRCGLNDRCFPTRRDAYVAGDGEELNTPVIRDTGFVELPGGQALRTTGPGSYLPAAEREGAHAQDLVVRYPHRIRRYGAPLTDGQGGVTLWRNETDVHLEKLFEWPRFGGGTRATQSARGLLTEMHWSGVSSVRNKQHGLLVISDSTAAYSTETADAKVSRSGLINTRLGDRTLHMTAGAPVLRSAALAAARDKLNCDWRAEGLKVFLYAMQASENITLPSGVEWSVPKMQETARRMYPVGEPEAIRCSAITLQLLERAILNGYLQFEVPGRESQVVFEDLSIKDESVAFVTLAESSVLCEASWSLQTLCKLSYPQYITVEDFEMVGNCASADAVDTESSAGHPDWSLSLQRFVRSYSFRVIPLTQNTK